MGEFLGRLDLVACLLACLTCAGCVSWLCAVCARKAVHKGGRGRARGDRKGRAKGEGKGKESEGKGREGEGKGKERKGNDKKAKDREASETDEGDMLLNAAAPLQKLLGNRGSPFPPETPSTRVVNKLRSN